MQDQVTTTLTPEGLPPFPWPPESALARYPLETAERIRRAARDTRMVVFDFDGVFTDNAVWVTEDGHELVRSTRWDGFGLARLRARGLNLMVLSTEVNPVVTARCRKLRLECKQGIQDKLSTLLALLEPQRIPVEQVAFVGNDINDAGCLHEVGFPITIGDSHPAVLHLGLYQTCRPGGHGAVREVCDLIDHLQG